MKDRLWVAGVLGGMAALVILAIAVFKFGIKDPSPQSMRDEPNGDIAGEIAYADDDGCIRVIAAAGGDSREVTCVSQFGGEVTWVDRGHVAYLEYGPQAAIWWSVDVETGDEEELGPMSSTRPPVAVDAVSPNGERLHIEHPGGDIYRISGGERVRIFDYDGPDSWTPEYLTWSPDGEWVLLRYGKEEEFWVIRRDGSFAGTLAGGVGYVRPSWFIEGVGVLPEANLPSSR